MIFEIFGLPRAGKTTLLAKIAQDAKDGKSGVLGRKYKAVYTTFFCSGINRIDFDALPYYDFSDSLIIIDEISLFADNRDFKKFDKNLLEFFKLHGHQKMDIVWCSQGFTDADKKIRDLTDTIFYVSASFLPHISIVRRIIHTIDFAGGDVKDLYTLESIPKIFFRKKWYKYFDSYEHKELPKYNSEVWGNSDQRLLQKKEKAPRRSTSSIKRLLKKGI